MFLYHIYFVKRWSMSPIESYKTSVRWFLVNDGFCQPNFDHRKTKSPMSNLYCLVRKLFDIPSNYLQSNIPSHAESDNIWSRLYIICIQTNNFATPFLLFIHLFFAPSTRRLPVEKVYPQIRKKYVYVRVSWCNQGWAKWRGGGGGKKCQTFGLVKLGGAFCVYV